MLAIKNLIKIYEGNPLLNRISFSVSKGETVCLLGPSGVGKSTILRIIAGLEEPDGGDITWDQKSIINLPAHKRKFGLMFQDYALFPHRNVYQNVSFGLQMANWKKEDIQVRVGEMLDKVNMSSFASRRVTDLSGGEQQRVALARALAPQPRLLLLDEPLGALDKSLKDQLIMDLRRVLHDNGTPAIYVTHDQEEAFTISDRLIILNQGRILQSGKPAEVNAHPASAWVAKFLGYNNIITGTVINRKPLKVKTDLGTYFCKTPDNIELSREKQIWLLFYPDRASFNDKKPGENALQGIVEDLFYTIQGFRIYLRCDHNILFQFVTSEEVKVGSRITVTFKPDAILCLEDSK